jgi:hypothetical protein
MFVSRQYQAGAGAESDSCAAGALTKSPERDFVAISEKQSLLTAREIERP